MLSETVQLEKLRQKIEDLREQSGDRANYIDYGKPSHAQLKEAQATLKKLDVEIKAGQAELKQSLDTLRAQQPQVIEEWVKYHVSLLEKVIGDPSTDRDAGTRKYVAKETIEEWNKLLAGQTDYVNINGHFLKAYKNHVRSFSERSQIGEAFQPTSGQAASNQAASKDKAWWQFWK
jgi:hypothetical protein